MAKKERQSGIELLRIIAILQVIYLHVYLYGKLHEASAAAGSLDGALVTYVWSLCRAPVDLFIMISGYFMITSTFDIGKTIKRAATTYGAMIFYSLTIAAIFFIFDPNKISVVSITKAFFPLTSKIWYFLSNYILIVLLSPFLNRMLTTLTKRQYLYLVSIVFFVMSVWSTISYIDGLSNVFQINKIVDPYYGKSLGGFLLFYIIGGYLRLFVPSKEKVGKKHNLQFKYLIIFVVLCTIDFVLRRSFDGYSKVFGAFNNPLVVIESACLILFFRDFKFRSKFINIMAGTTLGVYAIHEHHYVRTWLWNIFDFSDKALYDSLIYIPLTILVCLIVFVACALIELLRLKIFALFSKLFSKAKKA